jgi:uncharacterized lipoprotein YajG
MQPNYSRLACLLFVLLLFPGCALTKETIHLTYMPRTEAQRVAGAEHIQVSVQITDGRSIRDRVGVKKNGYGMEMAPIVAGEDVVKLVQSTFESELARRSFTPGDAVVVTGDLTKFYNDFKLGFWSGDSIAEFIVTVQVRSRDGTILYTKNLVAEGKEPNIQVAVGHNAKAALELALSNGVSALFQDSAFISSLFKAAGKSAPATASTQQVPQPSNLR